MAIYGADNKPHLKWEIYYGDGSVICDYQMNPWDVPKENVQCVVVEDLEHGRVVCKADHFYVWDTYDNMMSWQGVDEHGYHDYIRQPGVRIVLFGRTLGNKTYREIVQRAMNSEYLPQKTAWHVGERQPA